VSHYSSEYRHWNEVFRIKIQGKAAHLSAAELLKPDLFRFVLCLVHLPMTTAPYNDPNLSFHICLPNTLLSFPVPPLLPHISSTPSPVWSPSTSFFHFPFPSTVNSHFSASLTSQFPPLSCFQIPPRLAGQQATWQIWRRQISQRVFICYHIAEKQADKYAAFALQCFVQQGNKLHAAADSH